MVEIKIINDSLDLFPNEVISFTLAINDLASIENRQGNYSNQFTIPATANNSSILGYADKLNFVSGFKPTKSREARLLIDGLEIQRGFIQVEQYDDTSKEFTISFFSGNTDWIDDIGDKSLRDLDTSDYEHVYDVANITASFTNTEGYIYPWINYGRHGGRTNNDTQVTDWKPAMFTHTIIKQIFKDADWKVKGNLFDDPFFLKEVVNYNSEPSLGEEVLEGLGFKASNNGGYSPGIAPIVFDNVEQGNTYADYDDSTGVYTCSQGFRGTVRCRVETTVLDAVEIRVNGVAVKTGNSQVARYLEYTGSFVAGDTIDIRLVVGTPLSSKRQIFELAITDRIVEGVTIRMNSVLPDFAQSDFINDVFNRYGALFSVDNISRTVYIDKFESVKDNIANAIDWTDKLDLSREIEADYTELVSDYGKRNLYKYTPNDDVENSLGNLEDFNTDIGDGFFRIDNDFISKEEEIFESAFSSSIVVGCYDGDAIAMYIPIYDTTSDIKEQREVTPRISIVSGLVDVSDIFTNGVTDLDINSNFASGNVDEVPFCYFHISDTGIDSVDSIGQGLSFGNNLFPVDQANLLDTYYEDYIKILNNPRRVTAYFLLNERDINNLDFLTPIYLGGELNSYFYINQIEDYRPNEGGVTKVELVLI